MTEVRRWLERTALDLDFLALAQADPEASFAGFELTERERALLGGQAGELLELLAEALAPMEALTGRSEVSVGPAPPPAPILPDTVLYLRLVPGVGENGALHHTVSLYTDKAESGLGAGVFAIRVSALASPAEDGQVAIAYDATLEATVDSPADPNGPWGHRVDSAEAREAAAAVLSADPSERRARLADLVRALVG